MQLTDNEIATLKEAYDRLENPSLVIRLSSAFGMPVEAAAKPLIYRAPESIVDIAAANKAATTIPRSPLGRYKRMNCGKTASWAVFRTLATAESMPSLAGKS